jgi:hypothetical protein
MQGKETTTVDGLHRVRFWEDAQGAAYVKPGAQLDRYTHLMLDEITVAYKRPPHREGTNSFEEGNFALPPTAMADLKKFFQETFTDELKKSQAFSVAADPAPGVLRVAGHIVNLSVNVEPFADQDPDATIYGQSPGSFTMILDVLDSRSGDPLVRLAHFASLDYGAASGLRQSNPVRNSAAVRQAFQSEARILREYLERLRELPEIPEPPNTVGP